MRMTVCRKNVSLHAACSNTSMVSVCDTYKCLRILPMHKCHSSEVSCKKYEILLFKPCSLYRTYFHLFSLNMLSQGSSKPFPLVHLSEVML